MAKLSAEKRKELQKLAARPDREIDLSDIPEIREIPSDAVIGRFYRPKKATVTIRLDVDVVAWLKATGDGYQTRINTYLRHLMQQHRQQLGLPGSDLARSEGGYLPSPGSPIRWDGSQNQSQPKNSAEEAKNGTNTNEGPIPLMFITFATTSERPTVATVAGSHKASPASHDRCQ